jgi:hypothetical protein
LVDDAVYEKCGSDWRKMGKIIKSDEEGQQKLVERLRAVAG